LPADRLKGIRHSSSIVGGTGLSFDPLAGSDIMKRIA
jgi:hypothetical protein